LKRKSGAIAYDKEDNPVFFAESEWMLKLAKENFPSITFHKHLISKQERLKKGSCTINRNCK
jgi:peptide subunit release factor RF-3